MENAYPQIRLTFTLTYTTDKLKPFVTYTTHVTRKNVNQVYEDLTNHAQSFRRQYNDHEVQISHEEDKLHYRINVRSFRPTPETDEHIVDDAVRVYQSFIDKWDQTRVVDLSKGFGNVPIDQWDVDQHPIYVCGFTGYPGVLFKTATDYLELNLPVKYVLTNEQYIRAYLKKHITHIEFTCLADYLTFLYNDRDEIPEQEFYKFRNDYAEIQLLKPRVLYRFDRHDAVSANLVNNVALQRDEIVLLFRVNDLCYFYLLTEECSEMFNIAKVNALEVTEKQKDALSLFEPVVVDSIGGIVEVIYCTEVDARKDINRLLDIIETL